MYFLSKVEEGRRVYFISVFIMLSLKPLLKFVEKVGIRACLSGSYFSSSFQTVSYVLVHILGFSLNPWRCCSPRYFVFSSKLRSVYIFLIYYFISSSTLEVGRAVFIIMPIFKMKNL